MPNFGVIDELCMEQTNISDLTVISRAELPNYAGKTTARIVCRTLGYEEATIDTRDFLQHFSNGA
jgi:hypothetical protein